MYRPKDFCIATPRTVDLDGSRVAIGGSVTITPEPPLLPKIIAEATQSQYKKLYLMGFTTLIDSIENVEESLIDESPNKKKKNV